MSLDNEAQIQRLCEDINDVLLFEDEDQLNFFDISAMLSDLGVLGVANIGRELLEDKVEVFTSYLAHLIGRPIDGDQGRGLLEASDARCDS